MSYQRYAPSHAATMVKTMCPMCIESDGRIVACNFDYRHKATEIFTMDVSSLAIFLCPELKLLVFYSAQNITQALTLIDTSCRQVEH